VLWHVTDDDVCLAVHLRAVVVSELPPLPRSHLLYSADARLHIAALPWAGGSPGRLRSSHLFHPHCPHARADARRRWGITYNTMPYWPAWGAMLGNLDEVGKHYWADAAKGVAKVKMG
jgi:hypothetical protein